MSRGIPLDHRWLQQQIAANPDLARRNAPLREARAAQGVRTPVVDEDREAAAFREALLTQAKAHDWSIHETWNPTRPDRGYHCWLVREGRLLRVEWHPEHTVLSPAHTRFNTRLHTVAGVEVILWNTTDMTAIEAVLR